MVGGKFYTCKSGKWDKGTKSTPLHTAYTNCKLWEGNTSLGFKVASVVDRGRTLVMDSVGKYDILDSGLTYSQLLCTLKVLRAPAYVRSQIESTRAIDGMQRASWGAYNAFWTYHPDDGVNFTVSTG